MKKISTVWNQTSELYALLVGTDNGESIEDIIRKSNPNVKTEADLQQLKQEYPEYYQNGNTTKGSTSPMSDGSRLIQLFETADESTFLQLNDTPFLEGRSSITSCIFRFA